MQLADSYLLHVTDEGGYVGKGMTVLVRRWAATLAAALALLFPPGVAGQASSCGEVWGPCAVPAEQDVDRMGGRLSVSGPTETRTTFWIPDFVPVEALGRGAVVHPATGAPSEVRRSKWISGQPFITESAQARHGIYVDLFYDLLLSIDPEEEEALKQELASISTAAQGAGGAGQFVGVARGSRFLDAENWPEHLGGALQGVSVLLELTAASSRGAREAALAWAGLVAYQEARAEALAEALRASSLTDDVISRAFSEALVRIREEQRQSREELVASARAGAILGAGAEIGFRTGITKLAVVLASHLGAAGAAITGLSAAGVSLVLWAMKRERDEASVEASLVLGTTLERSVLRPFEDRGALSGSTSAIPALRRQLSRMLAGYALRYGSDAYCLRTGLLDPNFRSADGTSGREYRRRAQDWADLVLQSQGYTLGRRDKMVVLILDSSGSMGQNDPERMRVTTSELLVDHIGAEASFGLVDFDTQVRLLTTVPIRDDPEEVKALVRATDADGGTNITEALLEAVGFVDRFNVCGRPELLLFTDGEHNEGPPISTALDVLANRGWPVSVIGLSDDVNDRTLRDVAQSSGGVYFRAASPDQLVDYFSYTSFRASGSVVSRTLSDVVRQGELKTASFLLDPSMRSLRAEITWPGSDLDLSLTDPNGRVFGARSAGVDHVEGERYEVLRVVDPVPGVWTASVEGVSVSGSEPFTLRTGGRSGFELDLGLVGGADTVPAGSPLLLEARIGASSPSWAQLTIGLEVLGPSRRIVLEEQVSVTAPSLILPELSLPEQVGEYEVRGLVTGRGVDGDTLFVREVRNTLSVRPVRLPRVTRIDGGYLRLDWGAGRIQVGDVVRVIAENGEVAALATVISVYPQYSEAEVAESVGPAVRVGMRARVTRR